MKYPHGSRDIKTLNWQYKEKENDIASHSDLEKERARQSFSSQESKSSLSLFWQNPIERGVENASTCRGARTHIGRANSVAGPLSPEIGRRIVLRQFAAHAQRCVGGRNRLFLLLLHLLLSGSCISLETERKRETFLPRKRREYFFFLYHARKLFILFHLAVSWFNYSRACE